MARKSDIQRALLGAISGGAGNIGYQWEQQRRAQMVEDQRAAEAAERERQRIDAEGRAYGRQILPQSPPLGTPMGGVIPQGMPGMTAGGLEDAIRTAQYQRAQQALLPEPADPLADLKLQHERAQLEWDLANMGADPVLERQKALVDYKNSLGGGGAAPGPVGRGAQAAIARGEYGRISTYKDAPATLEPGSVFTQREFLGFKDLTPASLEAEKTRLVEMGRIDPRDSGAGEAALRSLMLSPQDRALEDRRFYAKRALDGLVVDGAIPDYQKAIGAVMAVGFTRDEARAFVSGYQPGIAVDDPAITSQF